MQMNKQDKTKTFFKVCNELYSKIPSHHKWRESERSDKQKNFSKIYLPIRRNVELRNRLAYHPWKNNENGNEVLYTWSAAFGSAARSSGLHLIWTDDRMYILSIRIRASLLVLMSIRVYSRSHWNGRVTGTRIAYATCMTDVNYFF